MDQRGNPEVELPAAPALASLLNGSGRLLACD
jgi:hypothetical protein